MAGRNAKTLATILPLLAVPTLLFHILHQPPLATPADHRQTINTDLNPAHQQLALKLKLLELTNIHRLHEGLLPLRLGYSPAPQLHAQHALKGCYNSHWDKWGLRPAHRLALAGHTGFNLENVIGLNDCVNDHEPYAPLKPIQQEIQEAVHLWMNSPGHRRAILNPAVNTLHIGLAHDSHNIRIVQHFEAQYVSYSHQPHITPDGILHIQGKVQSASLAANGAPTLRIGYEPPPHRLTRGQLARTYALCIPTTVATVYQPDRHNSSLRHLTHPVSTPACSDPTAADPALPAPTTPDESNQLFHNTKQALARKKPSTSTAARIPADIYLVGDHNFRIEVDLSELLERHGPGIYSAILFGKPDHMEEATLLTTHPIFWNTSPPDDNPYTKHPEKERNQ